FANSTRGILEIPRKTAPAPEAAWARRLTHRPGPPRQTAGVARPGGRLPHGGEGRWDQQLVFLPDRPHPGLGRPRSAGLAGCLTHACTLVEILVDPDVHELVQPAELACPAGRPRREFFPPLHCCAPPLQHLGDVA